MPRSYQTGEFSSFVGGLFTEASPLTFPENASITEQNFVLNRDGSRSRRLGMDIENDDEVTFRNGDVEQIYNIFVWERPGNIANKSFIVIQLEREIIICDRSDDSLEGDGWFKWAKNYGSYPLRRWEMASVDGELVIASGAKEVTFITYDGSNLDDRTDRIKVRDTFGVEASDNLTEPEGFDLRPLQGDLSTAERRLHVYNLRNQGWAKPRLVWGSPAPIVNNDLQHQVKHDPILDFRAVSTKPKAGDLGGPYTGADPQELPSNADIVTPYLYAETSRTAPNIYKASERFDRFNSYGSASPKFRAPQGYFVIDLLDRGTSRTTEYNKLQADFYTGKNPSGSAEPNVDMLDPAMTGLPSDSTSTGATAVAEYSGKVFYAGFGGTITGKDKFSPDLTSYVFYSQTVKDSASTVKCYQEGDPTSADSPDLLDTDGGFIRIAGAGEIIKLVPLGDSLLVFAVNGVWRIYGSDSGYFSANSQGLEKVTEKGIIGRNTAVTVEGTIMYWADDGIYRVAINQLGSYEALPVTDNIKTYYQSISDEDKVNAQGFYDSYEKKVKWLYKNTQDRVEDTVELVYDALLNAFSPNVIQSSADVAFEFTVLLGVEVPPYNIINPLVNVIDGSDNVIDGSDNIVIEGPDTLRTDLRETSYLTFFTIKSSNTHYLKWSTYKNEDFKDWGTQGDAGADAKAELLTGYLTAGDNMRHKQVPYIFFHFLRTETGFEDLGDDLAPLGESSCIVQSQWEWSDSPNYGKWSKPFQAYRLRRQWMPPTELSDFDYGTRTVISKNKLRGRGRALSLYITSEEEKDLRLLGWSMLLGVNDNA